MIQRVVVSEGTRDRAITVDFSKLAPPPVEPRRDERRPIPLGAFVLGGVALVELGSFVAFGLAGTSTERCVPNCTQRDRCASHRRGETRAQRSGERSEERRSTDDLRGHFGGRRCGARRYTPRACVVALAESCGRVPFRVDSSGGRGGEGGAPASRARLEGRAVAGGTGANAFLRLETRRRGACCAVSAPCMTRVLPVGSRRISARAAEVRVRRCRAAAWYSPCVPGAPWQRDRPLRQPVPLRR